MPRLKGLTAEQKIEYQVKRARDVAYMLLDDKNVSYTDIAAVTGVTPAAVSHQFKAGTLKLETALAVIYLTKADTTSIEKMVRAE